MAWRALPPTQPVAMEPGGVNAAFVFWSLPYCSYTLLSASFINYLGGGTYFAVAKQITITIVTACILWKEHQRILCQRLVDGRCPACLFAIRCADAALSL